MSSSANKTVVRQFFEEGMGLIAEADRFDFLQQLGIIGADDELGTKR